MTSPLIRISPLLPSVLALATLAQAQAPRLLKDINPIPITNPSSDPYPMDARGWNGPQLFSQLGNSILLAATTRAHGTELWISDGTIAGTKLIKDINPGVQSSSPERIIVTRDGKRAFFSADDGKTGKELWVTDGTKAGTYLVMDIQEGKNSGAAGEIMTIGASSVIFRSGTRSTGLEPWISDGTTKGTRMLKDIKAGTVGSYSLEFRSTQDGKKVFFTATSGSSGAELWSTDGTPSGTVLVKTVYAGTQAREIASIVSLGTSQVMFRARDKAGEHHWWISNGSSAGTVPLLNPSKGLRAWWGSKAMSLGSKVLFEGKTASTGAEVYVTDGTAKGTTLLIDAMPGKGSAYFRSPRLDSTGKKVYWIGTVGPNQGRFLVSDGTPSGTKMFSPKMPLRNLGPALEVGGRLFFAGKDITPGTGWELCVSDGTAAGTKTFRDTQPGSKDGSAQSLTRTRSGSLFYVADDGVHGRELWTMRNPKTFQLLDINNPKPVPTQSAYPLGVARFGKNVFFSAFDGVSGTETWISDGTTSGTRRLKDLVPGIISSLSHYYAVAGDQLIFDAFTPATGMELFVTDGTPAGTKLLKDVRPGSASSHPSYLQSVGGKVYFSCNDGKTGFEPWVTDGTAAGTRLVKDLYPGSLSSSPHSFSGQGDKIVFGGVGSDGKFGLFFTDGSASGTKLLKTMTASSMVFSGGIVFFAGWTPGLGTELWITDFTPLGTTLVVDLLPGMGSGLQSPFLDGLSARNGRVFFTGYTKATGTEVFVSNGTPAGTRVFLDSRPGSTGSSPRNISAIGSRKVYFTGYSLAAGHETMISDGTIAGTRTLDLDPGQRNGAASFPYTPNRRGTLGSQVLFPARHPTYGLEIFTVDNGATTEPLGTPYGRTWIKGTDPVLGKTVHIEGLTGLAHPIHLTVMGNLATRPQRFGSTSFLHIDLATFFRITPATGGAQISHSIPIPNLQGLKGVQVVIQTLAFDSTNFIGTFELSNALSWTLGN